MWTLLPTAWDYGPSSVGMSVCPKKCSNEVDDFFLLFQQMRNKLSKLELERWTVTAWAIWNARNKFYFQQIQTHPRVILERANGLLVSTSDGSTVPSSMRYRSAVSSVYVVSVFFFLFFLVYVGSTAALYLLLFPPSQSFGSVSLVSVGSNFYFNKVFFIISLK